MAVWTANVVVAVGWVGSGGGRVERRGYATDPGRKSSMAATIYQGI